jgi:hypothetical protein
MRSLFPLSPVLLALGLTLAGCTAGGPGSTAPYEITGSNQVILEVPGMT